MCGGDSRKDSVVMAVMTLMTLMALVTFVTAVTLVTFVTFVALVTAVRLFAPAATLGGTVRAIIAGAVHGFEFFGFQITH
jgi:hypothetical protein